jgi:hypothetical protein
MLVMKWYSGVDFSEITTIIGEICHNIPYHTEIDTPGAGDAGLDWRQ